MNLNLNNIFNTKETFSISKVISYKDNRLHIIFNDKSSLILHAGGSMKLLINLP